MKEGCKTCKFNRERNLKQKTCLKGYRAVYGFGCNEYQREVNIACDSGLAIIKDVAKSIDY